MKLLSKQIKSCFVWQFTYLRSIATYNYSDVSNSSEHHVIKTPQKMVQKLEKLKERGKRGNTKPKRRGPLIISCERKSYNFRRHEHFNKDTDFFKLVSCGWKNRKRNGDQFTLVSYAANPSLQQENAVTFNNLGLNDELCERLHALGYETPTQIQSLAVPPFLHGQNIVCAAETGSGKTLSYLLPAVERITQLKKYPMKEPDIDGHHLGNPHTVIISPNRELTQQVMSMAESLTSSTDIVTQCVVGGINRKSDLKEYADKPMDILITTPGTLNKMLANRCLKKSNLQSIIIDEADTLLDDSFLPDIHKVLHRFQAVLSTGPIESSNPFLDGVQLALVSATMPRDLDNAIGHIIPVDSLTKIKTPALHCLMPHVPQLFHRINPDNKPEKLIRVVKRSLDKGQVILIFTKNSQTCFYLKKLFKDNGLTCLLMNGELKAQERDGVFLKFKEGYCDILIATDIASRGLDTTNVHHVINYDFPNFLSDYVHRVGRVGRVGVKHTGCVTSFVSHKWEVELLWKIETAARMGKQLDNVNANIKRKLEGLKRESDIFTIDAVA